MKQKSQTGTQIAETNLKRNLPLKVNNGLDAQLNKWLAEQETDQVAD